jgi:hypothetical protein
LFSPYILSLLYFLFSPSFLRRNLDVSLLFLLRVRQSSSFPGFHFNSCP